MSVTRVCCCTGVSKIRKHSVAHMHHCVHELSFLIFVFHFPFANLKDCGLVEESSIVIGSRSMLSAEADWSR